MPSYIKETTFSNKLVIGYKIMDQTRSCENCVSFKNEELKHNCVGCTFNLPVIDHFVSKFEFYPLELQHNEVCLWSNDGSHKWAIGNFIGLDNEEGPKFKFCGERPFTDPRVNWIKFGKLIQFGYALLKERTKHENN